MAQNLLAEKPSTAGGRNALAAAYHSLRVIDEQLQETNREICRLMAVKVAHFGAQPEVSKQFRKYQLESFEDSSHMLDSEWWAWATRNGLLESEGNLDRELEKTKASKIKFEGIWSDLRSCIDELSRPSQLLVRLVRVSFDELSLTRLEEISHHPAIAKGVRVVQIALHFYNIALNDFDRFISYLIDMLENQVNLFDALKDFNIPEQSALEMIADTRAVILELHQLASTQPELGEHFQEEQGLRARLEEICSEHLTLFEKQQSLIWSGRFSQAVGSAIARMPGARRLDFNDTEFAVSTGNRQLMIPKGNTWRALRRFILQSLTGYRAKAHSLDLPNYQCIAKIVDAVRCAGVSLKTIKIELSDLGCPGSLMPSPDIRREFSSGLQQLAEFKFECDSPDEQDAEGLNDALSVYVDTPSLQKLSLDMRSYDAGEPGRIDIGQIMGSRSRDRLTDISFAYAAMDFSRMVQFLNRLPQSTTCISLIDVRLLSGTWKEALDALRKKNIRIVHLSEPKGAECDNMSPEDYKRIFDDKCAYRTLAELYITNRISQQRNPLETP
ncbi:hypothetical protein SAPIO_CDS4063 [Scedosporium apiospermum]|uniref:Uncharacterized protein n=1 Tax=Pseudallescheria apiosperma TaxID=563466 RepID=A0A084G977_PSEDA|nr:uncharacterized protein SAPIO_CDS4063 [Scedosporium apiospermum]KEZ43889.1 hypothetical protein SAPIO_CDS4063 [Scedosporium apiospermum]